MSLLDLPDNQYGLLSLGLRMMSTPGNFGQALGQAGMGALGDVQQHSASKQRRAFTDLQTQQVRMQMEEAERQRRSQEALRGYMGGLDPDAGMTPDMPGPRREPQEFNFQTAIARGADFGPALQMQQALQKAQPEEYTLTPGAARFRGNQQIAAVPAAPKEGAQSPLAKLLAERDALPPNSPMRALYDQMIQKTSTHQPPIAQISYGQPLPAVNPQTGETEFVRPDNKGGMAFTGVRPPPQNRDTKPPAEIQRMNIAIDTMGQMLNRYEDMLKKYNPRDPLVQANPAVRADFQSLMKGIQLQFKEVQALGALAGPDLGIMEAAITDPFTFKGAYYGRGGLQAQINQARQLLKERKSATDASQGRPAAAGAPQPASADPLGLRGGN